LVCSRLEQLGFDKSAEIKNFLLQHQQQKSGIKGVIGAGHDRFGHFIVHKSIDGKRTVFSGVPPPPLPSPSFTSLAPHPVPRNDSSIDDRDDDRRKL